jgi:hypothetical protein
MNQKQHENLSLNLKKFKPKAAPSVVGSNGENADSYLLNEYQILTRNEKKMVELETPSSKNRYFKQQIISKNSSAESVASLVSNNKPALNGKAVQNELESSKEETSKPFIYLAVNNKGGGGKQNGYIETSLKSCMSNDQEASRTLIGNKKQINNIDLTNNLSPQISVNRKNSKNSKQQKSSSPTTTSVSTPSLPFPSLLNELNTQAKKTINTPNFAVKTNFLFHHQQAKSNMQAQVYNFLERPTGWKCFIYHFTV